MSDQPLMSAKAISVADRSDAIVVSFDADWYERLRRREFSAVIRKRVPVHMNPSWLYFHINSPKSAICARAALRKMGRLDIAEAAKLSDALGLSRQAIKTYLGKDTSIGVYWLKRVEFPETEITTAILSTRMTYNPPQSFFVLSSNAKKCIDEIGGF